MNRLIAVIILALAMSAPLSACGKKGDPEAPDKGRSVPHPYPRSR